MKPIKKDVPVAIVNKGKNNSFINNWIEIDGIGILDEGEGTIAQGNVIASRDNESGNNTERWYQKWWIKYLIFPLAVTLVGGILLNFLVDF